MAWKYLPLIYRVLSPIHIGYRSVGIIDRTRYYVPSKNFWAAVTSRLTPKLYPNPKPGNYKSIGDLIQTHFRFSYFYLATASAEDLSANLRFYLPKYSKRSTIFLENPKKQQGDSEANVEAIFIGSYVSTGLDYARHAAMDSMLHEIEYIKPHVLDHGEILDSYLVGGVWVNPGEMVQIDGSTILIKERPVLNQLTVGGELGYGFGRLELTDVGIDCLGLSGWQVKEESQNDLVVYQPNKRTQILAHVKYKNGQIYKGSLEPIVGREWNDEKGAGRSVAKGFVCVAPGGRCPASAYEIDGRGYWSVVA